ncbi:MAG: helix-turn-helix transcriptional regulator [Bacteroidia bacterium]|nr:helix-turn-helix transcriptional regulator [Bacteroidia bacterium]
MELPYEIGEYVLFKASKPDIQREAIQMGVMLKTLSVKEELTQNEVTTLSGTSRTYILRIENNQSGIELFALGKIVKAGFNKKLILYKV